MSALLGWEPDVVEQVIAMLRAKSALTGSRFRNWAKYQRDGKTDSAEGSWFRIWRGMPSSPKWALVAQRVGLQTGVVIGVVWALLERASVAEERGSIGDVDLEEIAICLDVGPVEIQEIISELGRVQVLTDDRFSNWGVYQPKRENDPSAQREAARRARKRALAQEF